MILLLGGTSESAPVAAALAAAGHRVLVSTATAVPLDVGTHPNIRKRSGKLNVTELAALLRADNFVALVDAAHPYAIEAHATAQAAAAEAGVPYLRFARPGGEFPGDVLTAADHASAAQLAVSFGKPILLTTGSRNLRPYAETARARGVALAARVLPDESSLAACREAGIEDARIIAARGPFSVEENRAAIQRHRIGVLVTKDSGAAGGVPEKLEAARLENCRVVLVRRPPQPEAAAHGNIPALVAALQSAISR